MIVAIDGPAGAGKSSVAEHVAKTFGFLYLNSGNFYRAVTYMVLSTGKDPENENEIRNVAGNADMELINGRIHVNGEDIDDHLHNDEIDRWVAQHSAITEVRKIVNGKIREATRNIDIVAEGRDMTTVVFPEAEVKIFLDADLDIRARRRLDQGTTGMDLGSVEKSLKQRDKIDREKPFAL